MSGDWNDDQQAGRKLPDPDGVAVPINPTRDRLPRLTGALRDAREIIKRGPPKNPVRTGYSELDAGLKHLGPEEVTLLAADSGIGKSTVVTQTAIHNASHGHGVVYLNLEMASAMYGLRTLANFAAVPTTNVANGAIDGNELIRLQSAINLLREPAERIVLGNQEDHREIPAVRAFCARAKEELGEEGTPLGLVIIDHILQIKTGLRNPTPDSEGKARADLMKEIAVSLQCHVMALIHVTREGTKDGKMPSKNNVASSSWMDRHPDNILIFHQKRTPNGTFAGDKAVLSCQKARWGNPFAVELEYKGGFFYPWTMKMPESQ